MKEKNSKLSLDKPRCVTTVKRSDLDIPWWMFWADPVKIHLQRLLDAEEATMKQQKAIVVEASARFKKAAVKADKLRKALETL